MVSLFQYRALLRVHLLLHERSLLSMHPKTVWRWRNLIRGKALKSLEVELLVCVVWVLLALHGGLIHWILRIWVTRLRPSVKGVRLLFHILRYAKLAM